MNNHIKQKIIFEFENSFTEKMLVRISMPYLPFYSTNGYYSRFFKAAKEAAATGFEKRLVKGKWWKEKTKTRRTVISLDNGFALDIPYDATKKDLNIIQHHLIGFRMSYSK